MGSNPSKFQSPDRPVEQVSWDEVRTFLDKINLQRKGLDLILPTEAQWEYACRAGTKTPFSFEDGITPDQVNCDGNGKGTVPVKSLPPNPWGLYEMHGNVWEWCQDGQRDYRAEAETDPIGPSDPGAFRVMRGGSWFSTARYARSACRRANHPEYRYGTIGFRCARGQG
jgi:formylglycine-generating enzyme required for sulfatase activity